MRSMRLLAAAAALAAFAAAGTAVPAASAEDFFPGSSGLGDPYFPLGGNGGYDVQHYDLTLAYDPPANQLSATAVITAVATQNLSQFDLDLRGFDITGLEVDGAAAAYSRDGQELIITPAAGVVSGTTFTVTVGYAGTPSVVTDPDNSIEGWVPTDDGAVSVGEPQGSPGWYPCNDNPQDKATFDFTVTVPAGLTAMSNGVLVSQTIVGDQTTWRWREGDPMATYLATVDIGRFDLTTSSVEIGGRDIPSYVAVDPQLAKGQVLSKLPDAVRFYSSIYGPYPFDAVGAIVDSAKNLGYSLETQTKPLFPYVPNEATLVHELSHMWFGDSATLGRWPDIWLHEGFATWSEWIWSEHEGNKSAAQWFKQLYNTPAKDDRFWNPPPGDPGDPSFLFNGTIYYRGAMTLEALREKIGDDDVFFEIMRRQAQDNRYGTIDTPGFIALAEEVSGLDLDAFFQAWLFTTGKPTSW